MSSTPEEEILNNPTKPYDLKNVVNLLKGLINIANVTSRDVKQIKANEKINVDRIVALRLETRTELMKKMCDNLHNDA